MSSYPFASLESFQYAFTSGLSGLVKSGGLGPFILVCANASFDKRVQADTAAALDQVAIEHALDRLIV